MLHFRLPYFILTVFLFVVEVLIALFVHDSFVRPYLGDFLVVILVYCFIRSFLCLGVFAAAIAALLFSYLVEALQYLGLVSLLGLERNTLAKTVIGYGFDWMDILAYTLGIAATVAVEYGLARVQRRSLS